jgi:hypothetical protein
MYDSDGAGFFAVGILMIGVAYAFYRVVLDNIIWFLLAFVVFGALLYVYMKSNVDYTGIAIKWWRGKVNKVLYKLFGVTLYNSKIAWFIYGVIVFVVRTWAIFMSIILVMYAVAWLLNRV